MTRTRDAGEPTTPPGAKQIVVYDRWAHGLVVHSNEDRAGAIETLRQVKEQRAAVVEFFREMKTRAHAAWRAITEKESGYLKVLDAVEHTVKDVVLSYDYKQEEIRLKEERRLQVEADRQAGIERARLLKEAARIRNPERKEEKRAEAEAVVAVAVAVAPTLEHQEGETTRLTWKARVVNLALVPRMYLAANQRALDAHARETKGEAPIPGVEFYAEVSLAIGGR